MCNEDEDQTTEEYQQRRRKAQEWLEHEEQHPDVPIEDIKRALEQQKGDQHGSR